MKITKMTNPMTIIAVRNNAEKTGFEAVTYMRGDERYIKTAHCKKCGKDSMLCFRSAKKDSKYHTARACPCGYREFFGYGKTPAKEDMRTKSDNCTWDGKECMHWLQGGDPECVRTECRSYKKPIKITNKCIGKTCNNDLPTDRTSWCYSCRPKRRTVDM